MQIAPNYGLTPFWILSLAALALAGVRAEAGDVANQHQKLRDLAAASVDDYPALREAFLVQTSNRIDVVEAIQAGWDTGLMAWIVNARMEFPELAREWDKAPTMMRRSLRWHYVLSPTNVLGQAMNVERLWKGASIAGGERRRLGGKEFDILPRYARDEICLTLFDRPLTAPMSLWFAVVQGNAPAEVKAVAANMLPYDQSETARALALALLKTPAPHKSSRDDELRFEGGLRNTRLPEGYGLQIQKRALCQGLFRPLPIPYGWELLRDTYAVWTAETNVVRYGLLAVGQQHDPAAKAFLLNVAHDRNAGELHRSTALECLVDKNRHDSTNPELLSEVLRDASAPSSVKIAAARLLDYYDPSAALNLAKELKMEALDAATQEELIRVLVRRGGREHLSFIQGLSQRQDLSPEFRQVAGDKAREMSKWVK